MPEHTFFGIWEIVSCTFEGKVENSGLEGIKFRLDDTGDITWYNDLVSPLPVAKDCNTCCDSAGVLFSCETFDICDTNPRLIFGAFAGHSIEFNTQSLTPNETLILDCENWYTIECKRLKDDQAAGQENEITFIDALHESYFSDVIIKSSNGFEYAVHSSILRLNGFDCSMCLPATGNPSNQFNCKSTILNSATQQQSTKCKENFCGLNSPSPIKISVTTTITTATTTTENEEQQKSLPKLNLSPIYLLPPEEQCGNKLGVHRTHYLSNSFNCLSAGNEIGSNNSGSTTLLVVDGGGAGMRRFPPTSSSDSHLETQPHCKNIFNFCPDLLMQPTTDVTMVCNTRRPPLSPYRARSPSPFPSSMDTPPSSPLTPVGVLYNLPCFLLTPILHWLYTESLLPNLDDEVCEKLINFAEMQPSLTKMVEPTRKYLKLTKVKQFVIDVIMDLHGVLNRTIQNINPDTISHDPAILYETFKDCLKYFAIGCAKVLQFCNIFIKDAADISRYQKNEIVRYVRTRIPIFLSQFHQLLLNIFNVLIDLDVVEKTNLVNYLVPEIGSTLSILTNVIEDIKNSLEKMCKNLKCSHLNLSMKDEGGDAAAVANQIRTTNTSEPSNNGATLFNHPPLSPRPRRGPPVGLTLYDTSSDNRMFSGENDLKFVIYMFEVRKMRDIYGRISAALDAIREKKTTYCEMDFVGRKITIHQNLEQVLIRLPAMITILESLNEQLDEKLGWKEFKFCFKLATNQINGVTVKLFDHKAALVDPINRICKLVKKQEFTQSLVELGLLQQTNELKTMNDENNSESEQKLASKRVYETNVPKNVKLNLIKNLCEPPKTAHSNLAKNALRLLHSGQMADMEFEVHTFFNGTTSMAARTPTGKKHRHKSSPSHSTAMQVHTFRAHRVIVSARCEWFKKALLSGMQESITRKIIITDTTPVIFRRLLLYLYGAPIDKTVGADQICELMVLADLYTISELKELCENTLNSQIDEESVLCLLGIADHYMVSVLKSNCLLFLSKNAHLTKHDMFKELPQSLQLEVMDLIHWYGRVSEPWNDGFNARRSSHYLLKSPSKPRSRSRKSSPSYM